MTASLRTLPNLLTLARILMLPLMGWALQHDRGDLALVVLIAAGITDFLDGYFARKHRVETPVGKLMDPIADKIMLTVALIFLMAYGQPRLDPWLATLLLAREFLISGLRSMAAALGLIIPANSWGKTKLVLQMVGLGAYMLAGKPVELVWVPSIQIGQICLWASVVISYWSMGMYLMQAWAALGDKLKSGNRVL